ncbi:hypothetical protein [Actinospongicola halichondriae]|uniref:hypothetical protein n=1 Tax=Actinospongicola halichondriae TaxID=3236844 RepID=UPI003D5B0B98
MLEGRRIAGLIVVGVLAAACASADATLAVERSPDKVTTSAPSTTAPATTSSTTVPATTTSTTVAPTTTAAPTTTRPFVERVVVDTGFAPYAVVEGLVLLHPAAGVERIGFHESGHDGARQQDAVTTAARPMTLESRDRGTPDRTAADIVVVPDTEVRSPVTGTVIRAGAYTLYCDHVDEYAVIEPDDRPGWEVKMFHIVGLQVATGSRVEAGVTRVALHSRILPFESQVDEFTGEPSWPHVHVEVVDPSIPDRPNPGGGCS